MGGWRSLVELFLKHRIASASEPWHSETLRFWNYSHLLLVALEVHFHMLHGTPLLDPLLRRGLSLREYMKLPSRFKILLDSGAFELALPQFAPLRGQFSNMDIIEVAELVKPDLVVPLDIIVQEGDGQATRAAKIEKTLRHARQLVEAPQLAGQQVLGPLHGTPKEMLAMMKKYREWGITYFALGGPVFRSLEWVRETLPVVMREMDPRHERLHIFGLKVIEVGGDRQEIYYLRFLARMAEEYGVSLSTDTTRNITRTRQGYYLTREGRFVHLRNLDHLDCEAPCCRGLDADMLKRRLQENDVEAKMRLFIHNSRRWFDVASHLSSTPSEGEPHLQRV